MANLDVIRQHQQNLQNYQSSQPQNDRDDKLQRIREHMRNLGQLPEIELPEAPQAYVGADWTGQSRRTGAVRGNNGDLRQVDLSAGEADINARRENLETWQRYLEAAQRGVGQAESRYNTFQDEESAGNYQRVVDAYNAAVEAARREETDYQAALRSYESAFAVQNPDYERDLERAGWLREIGDWDEEGSFRTDRSFQELYERRQALETQRQAATGNERAAVQRQIDLYDEILGSGLAGNAENEEQLQIQLDYIDRQIEELKKAGFSTGTVYDMATGSYVPAQEYENEEEIEALERQKKALQSQLRTDSYEETYSGVLGNMEEGLRSALDGFGRMETERNELFERLEGGAATEADKARLDELQAQLRALDETLSAQGFSEEQIQGLKAYERRRENAETTRAVAEQFKEMTGEQGVFANWLNSTIFGIMSGMGYVDLAAQGLIRNLRPDAYTGEAAPIDYESAGMLAANVSGAILEKETEKLVEKYGAEKGQLLSNVYQLAVSMGQSAVVAGLSAMGMPAATLVLSFPAATQTAMEYHKKGYGDGAALAMGAVSGFAEYITEKVSIDSLLHMKDAAGIKTWLGNIGRQMLAEGSEEVASDLINATADLVLHLFEDKNGFLTDVEQYMLDNPGASKQEAEAACFTDFITGLAGSFIGGAVSGGLFGLGGTAINAAAQYGENVSAGREIIRSGETGSLQRLIGDIDASTRALLGLENVDYEKASDVGRAARGLEKAGLHGAVESRLRALGEAQVSQELVDAIEAQATQQRLSRAEKNALAASTYGQQVAEELGSLYEPGTDFEGDNTWARESFAESNMVQDTLRSGEMQELLSLHDMNAAQLRVAATRAEAMESGDWTRAASITLNNEALLRDYEAQFGPAEGSNTEKLRTIARTLRENARTQQENARIGTESAAQDVLSGETEENAGRDVSAANPVVIKLQNSLAQIHELGSVASVKGDEFRTGEGTITERIFRFINRIGGKVNRPGFGDVLFSKSKVRSSIIGHGAYDAKIAAFAAVPQVIQQGRQIDFQENWEGRGYDSYIFAAPITLNGNPSIVGVVVDADPNSNRYYVHEVVDGEGNTLFNAEIPLEGLEGGAAETGAYHTLIPSNGILEQSPAEAPSIGTVPQSPPVVNDPSSANAQGNGSESQYTPAESYVRGLLMDLSPSAANEILSREEYRRAFEALTGKELTGSRNSMRGTILSSALEAGNHVTGSADSYHDVRLALGQEDTVEFERGGQSIFVHVQQPADGMGWSAYAMMDRNDGTDGSFVNTWYTNSRAEAVDQILARIDQQLGEAGLSTPGAQAAETAESATGEAGGAETPSVTQRAQEAAQPPQNAQTPQAEQTRQDADSAAHTIELLYETGRESAVYGGVEYRVNQELGGSFTARAVKGQELLFSRSGLESRAAGVRALMEAQENGAIVNDEVSAPGEAKKGGFVATEAYRQLWENRAITSKTTRMLDALGRKLGVEIRFEDEVSGGAANASYRDGVITIAADTSDPVTVAAIHKAVHHIAAADEAAYNELARAVFDILSTESGSFARDFQMTAREYGWLDEEGRFTETGKADTLQEMVAQGMGIICEKSDILERAAKENRTLVQRFLDAITDFVESMLDFQDIGKVSGADRRIYAALGNHLEALQAKLQSALDSAGPAEGSGETKYSIAPTFARDFQQWVDSGKPDRKRLYLGTTSEALRSIQVDEKKVYWDTSKINEIQRKHPEMSDAVLAQVPELLEHPVLIMESKTQPNRLTVLGEVYGDNGIPVMGALELLPVSRGGYELNQIKVASAYTRISDTEQNTGAATIKETQKLIDSSNILYVEPNKNRTDTWLSRNQLQLPLGIDQYGPMGTIALIHRNSKGYFSAEPEISDMPEWKQKLLNMDLGETDAKESKKWNPEDARSRAPENEMEGYGFTEIREGDSVLVNGVRVPLAQAAATGEVTVDGDYVVLGNGERIRPEGISPEEMARKLNDLGAERQAQRSRPNTQEDAEMREVEEQRATASPGKADFRGTDAMSAIGIEGKNAISGSVATYRDIENVRQATREADKARREVSRIIKKYAMTTAEQEIAQMVARNQLTTDQIPWNMNREAILDLSGAYIAVNAHEEQGTLRRQRERINRQYDRQAARDFADSEQYKPAKYGTLTKTIMNERTARRVLQSIYGDEKGAVLFDHYFRTIEENNGSMLRWQKQQIDKVRRLEDSRGRLRELSRVESKFAQEVLEGQGFQRQVERLQGYDRKTVDAYLRNFEERLELQKESGFAEAERAAEGVLNGTQSRAEAMSGENAALVERVLQNRITAAGLTELSPELQKIVDGYEWYRQIRAEIEANEQADGVIIDNAARAYGALYDQFYQAINQFLVAHGYEEIGFIQGYAPHMQEEETRGLFAKTLNSLGIQLDEAQALPAGIAGRTADFKPNMRWNPHFQSRTGDKTDYNIRRGMDSYLKYMGEILYHTDDIMRLRRAVNYFRSTYGSEEIANNLALANLVRNAPLEEKMAFLQDKPGYVAGMSAEQADELLEQYVESQYEDASKLSRYSELTTWLENQANILAGKQSLADRGLEYSGGRSMLDVGNKLMKAFQRSNVLGNLSSALNQTAQLTVITTHLGAEYTARAVADIANGIADTAWREGSDFLMGKMGVETLDKGRWYELALDKAGALSAMMDSTVATIAVRGEYLRQIDSGVDSEIAMRRADEYARKVMGSRMKGETPQGFASKRFVSQMIHVFQVEAANSFDYVLSDLPREIRETAQRDGTAAAVKKYAGALVAYLLRAFVLNRLAEETYGGTPIPFDLFGMTAQLFASGEGITPGEWTRRVMDNALEDLGGERIFETERFDGDFDYKAAISDAGSVLMNDIPYLSNLAGVLGLGDQTLPTIGYNKMASGVRDVWRGLQGADEQFGGGDAYWDQVLNGVLTTASQAVPMGRQIMKSYQGARAVAQGGVMSGYGEDSQLKYAVENSFGNRLRGVLFGTSALSETDAFYAHNAKKLSANQTFTWHVLVDAGMSTTEAYEAIQQYRAIDKNKDLTSTERAAERRAVIAGLDISDRAKLETWLDLEANGEEENKKYQTMLSLMGLHGCSFQDCVNFLDEYQRISALDGTAGEKATEFAAWVDRYVSRQGLGDDVAEMVKRSFVYYSQVPAEASTYERLTDSGLSSAQAQRLTTVWNQLAPEEGRSTVSSLQKMYAISLQNLNEEQKYAAAATLTDREQYTDSGDLSEYGRLLWCRDNGVAFDDYLTAKRDGLLDKFIRYGQYMEPEAAMTVSRALNELEPEAGRQSVSDTQRIIAICSADIDEEYQLAAVEDLSPTIGYKLTQAGEYGVTPAIYARFLTILPGFDANGNGSYTQAEVQAAIDSMRGLDAGQRAALWQMKTGGKRNPYSSSVGNTMRSEYESWSAANR